ncbi:uncharacterized protein LTR77_010494 [Saxophila tyrrhenica]|uniref:Uncharacterized protein n=1 Tax=Saxophila tyrrhenica TaxID=1690608 RepID=A0AAV9NVK7_9PEZI|nr:hypothetical protein LTR77_010494 [Saxophila tyrrhenica]
MEHFHRTNPTAFGPSRGSSVYSTSSSTAANPRSTSPSYAESTTSTSSRPASTVPSYMNAPVTRKPIGKRPMSTANALDYQDGKETTAEQQQIPATAPVALTKGVLVLAVAREVHPKTMEYLGVMLRKGAYSRVVVVGCFEWEGQLKQLKMDLYALLGKLGLEVGVQVELRGRWSGEVVGEVVEKALAGEQLLHGVLCCPSFGTGNSDVLQLDEAAFAEEWSGSVNFLRNLARATVPRIKSNATSRAASGYFVVTEPAQMSPVSAVCKAACDRIVVMLADSNLRLTIAYADTVLIPEPEPVETNGKLDLQTDALQYDYYQDDFQGGESPTKLWNMWALQDQLNNS